jgi:ATPase subunit of ABC transporter with duplicated ATPase domains
MYLRAACGRNELNEISLQLQSEDAALDTLIRRQHQTQERYEREGGLTFRSRTRAALLGLGFSDSDLNLPATALSGGQLGKAMLARVLLSGAELLFLDEPTNDLDIASVEWLENYLKAYSGAYIVISHDRYFLDQVTNRTLELSGGKYFLTQGNYSTHVERRASAQEILRRQYRNTQKEIRRIYGIVEQQRQWNRERNIRTAESKLKQIERLRPRWSSRKRMKSLSALRLPRASRVATMSSSRRMSAKRMGKKTLFRCVVAYPQGRARVPAWPQRLRQNHIAAHYDGPRGRGFRIQRVRRRGAGRLLRAEHALHGPRKDRDTGGMGYVPAHGADAGTQRSGGIPVPR